MSTWFANARRRLKKENKMTWEPKNKLDDEDVDVSEENGTSLERSNLDDMRLVLNENVSTLHDA